MLVQRIAPFCDHAFPSLAARAFPGLQICERLNTLKRRSKWEFLQ
jgi:hypothetical protein